MKGLSRSLRYFTLLAGEYIGLSLIIAAACFVLCLLQSDNAEMKAFPVMFLFVMYLFIILFSMGHYMIMLSLLIPYSCTRRSLFWGTQYMMLLITGATLILLGIYFRFFTDAGLHGFFRLFPSMIGLFAASVGLGALFGGIILKFQRAAAVIMTLCSAILGGVFGFCITVFFDISVDTILTVCYQENMLYLLPAGFAVLLFGSAINYAVLRRAAVTR